MDEDDVEKYEEIRSIASRVSIELHLGRIYINYNNAVRVRPWVQERFPRGSSVYTDAGPHAFSICRGPILLHWVIDL